MKTLKLSTLMLSILFLGLTITSCQKEDAPEPLAQDNLIGTWKVLEGEGTVYSGGYNLGTVNIATSGNMNFSEEGSGNSDFTMDIAGDLYPVKGSFTWRRDGFEVITTDPNGDELRWSVQTNEKNMQVMTYTEEDEDDPTNEVEITLTLVRE